MEPPSNFNCRCRLVARRGIFARWWALIRRYPPSRGELAYLAASAFVVALWWWLGWLR